MIKGVLHVKVICRVSKEFNTFGSQVYANSLMHNIVRPGHSRMLCGLWSRCLAIDSHLGKDQNGKLFHVVLYQVNGVSKHIALLIERQRKQFTFADQLPQEYLAFGSGHHA